MYFIVEFDGGSENIIFIQSEWAGQPNRVGFSTPIWNDCNLQMVWRWIYNDWLFHWISRRYFHSPQRDWTGMKSTFFQSKNFKFVFSIQKVNFWFFPTFNIRSRYLSIKEDHHELSRSLKSKKLMFAIQNIFSSFAGTFPNKGSQGWVDGYWYFFITENGCFVWRWLVSVVDFSHISLDFLF